MTILHKTFTKPCDLEHHLVLKPQFFSCANEVIGLLMNSSKRFLSMLKVGSEKRVPGKGGCPLYKIQNDTHQKEYMERFRSKK